MATNGNFAHQEQYKGSADQYATPATIDPADASGASNDLSKDEVGWYFVEQYYTTLSKSPEKLHLFYGKRSQFVSGVEAEVANVSVGRQAIQERIKQLDFQDCKVRVSNVDSQASFDGIVIQVIGEVSSKSGEPKKFVQTFVLAQQPSGYFVLNDILRYIDDEAEVVAEAPLEVSADRPNADVTTTESAEPAAPAAEATKKESVELNTEAVDEKLEAAVSDEPAQAEPSVATPAVETAKPTSQTEATPSDPETAAQQLAEEEAKEPEKPQEPSPTPALGKAPAAQAEAAPAEPAAPPKPMTWASRAAAAAGPRPVVPLPKTATPPAQSQNRAPAPAAAPAAAAATASPASAAAPAATAAADASAKDASGWQTAGADSKRQNRPQSVSAPPTEKEGTLGYVKYVTEKVQDQDLRKALEAHGELAYFDINRQKVCAHLMTPKAVVC
jgi:hypothetical protein